MAGCFGVALDVMFGVLVDTYADYDVGCVFFVVCLLVIIAVLVGCFYCGLLGISLGVCWVV